jgi:uncharacterized protein YjaG (DUF416 family)
LKYLKNIFHKENLPLNKTNRRIKKMKTKIIAMILDLISERLSNEDIKIWIDAGLDILEDKIEKSKTKLDDRFILPVIKMCREQLDIPDDYAGDED